MDQYLKVWITDCDAIFMIVTIFTSDVALRICYIADFMNNNDGVEVDFSFGRCCECRKSTETIEDQVTFLQQRSTLFWDSIINEMTSLFLFSDD